MDQKQTERLIPENFDNFTPYTVEELGAVVARSRWIFAKTMPGCPHWYTLRREARTDGEFRRFIKQIRMFGYDERWHMHRHRYLDMDGWKYWTMGYLTVSTVLINRAKIERSPDLFSNPERPWVPNPVHFQAKWWPKRWDEQD